MPHPKRIFLTAIKFVVPALIIGYLLGWRIEAEDWRRLAEQPKRFELLSLALVVAIAALSLSFARWWLLVRAQGIELSLVEAFRLGSIGFLLSFVSAGSVGGDLFKAIFLARRRPGKRIEAVASVLVDRGCGLYALLLLVAIGLAVTGAGAGDTGEAAEDASAGADSLQVIRSVTLVLIAVGTAALAVLILGGRGVDRLIRHAGRWRWVGPLIERTGRPLRVFHDHPVAFAAAVLMGLGVQGMLAVSMFLIGWGLYASAPTLAEHLLIVPIGMLVSALPISPAGLGVLEAAMESLYRWVPSPPTEASGTLVALVFEVVKVVMAVLGTIFYWTAGRELRDSLELAEDEVDSGGDSLPAEAFEKEVGRVADA